MLAGEVEQTHERLEQRARFYVARLSPYVGSAPAQVGNLALGRVANLCYYAVSMPLERFEHGGAAVYVGIIFLQSEHYVFAFP